MYIYGNIMVRRLNTFIIINVVIIIIWVLFFPQTLIKFSVIMPTSSIYPEEVRKLLRQYRVLKMPPEVHSLCFHCY